MDIFKIIKLYFLVGAIMISAAAVSFDTNVRHFLASVIDIEFSTKEPRDFALDVEEFIPEKFSVRLASAENKAEDKNEETLIFALSKAELPYANPGEKGVPILDIVLTPRDGETVLKELNFKLFNGDADKIESIILTDKNGTTVSGKKNDNYFTFRGMNFDLNKGENLTLSMFADLSAETVIGERFEFGIEKASDIEMEVNGKIFEENNGFPMRGYFLTVVKKSL